MPQTCFFFLRTMFWTTWSRKASWEEGNCLKIAFPGKSCGIVSKPSKQSAKASRELQCKLLNVPHPQSQTRFHHQQFHDALGKHPIQCHFQAGSCHPSMFSHRARSSSHLEVCLQEILQEAKDFKNPLKAAKKLRLLNRPEVSFSSVILDKRVTSILGV